MVQVARLLRCEGVQVPLLIGGATTSQLHTALRIAPEYDGPVVWVKDAAQDVLVAATLMNPQTREPYLAELEMTYARLREEYTQRQPQTVSLEEARRRKLDLF